MEQSSSNGSPDVTSRVIIDSFNIPKLTCNWSIECFLLTRLHMHGLAFRNSPNMYD